MKKIEDNKFKYKKNLFRLKKEIDGTTIKDVRIFLDWKKKYMTRQLKIYENVLDWKKKNKAIRNIRNLFEHEEKDYCKPVKVGNFWSNNYMEYNSDGNRNETLTVE